MSIDAYANRFTLLCDTSSVLPKDRFLMMGGVEFCGIPDVQCQAGASWHEDNILGRSEPYRSFTFSTPTVFSFTGILVATGGKPLGQDLATSIAAGALGLTGRFIGQTQQFIGIAGKAFSTISGLMNGESQEAVENERIATIFGEVSTKAAWLEALTKPQYDSMGWAYPPPHCYLKHGQNFNRRGVVTGLTLTYKGPWEVNTLLCMVIEAHVTFTQDSETPPSMVDVAAMKQPDRVAVEPTGKYTTQKAIDNARALAGL